MGKFKYLVDNPALIEIFKEKYHISQEVSLRYCSPEGLAFDREVGEVLIPMIAFIEGGITLPMGRTTEITYVTIGFAPNSAHLIFLGF